MKIVIIGDGKVGFKLAKELSEEDYDVVLIDSNEKKLMDAINRMDIICVHGEGGSAEVQEEAGVSEADLVIACTSTDECNLLSCLIARQIGARHTIARVRNPIYYRQIDLLKKDLHLSMAVNPEFLMAGEIVRLLLFPNASKIETFVRGKVELIEFPVRADGRLVGMTLAEMYDRFQIKVLVCAVERGGDVCIPDGDFRLQAGDRLHVAASHRDIVLLFRLLGYRRAKIRRVMICGGGRVSFYLALRLCSMGMQVKIIEINKERCEELCEKLPKATIICGDASDHDLLIEEGIQESDAFIAMTGMDEENIIMSLFAKKQNVTKIIAKVNEEQRVRMVEEFGIDSTVSAKSVTVDAILGYVRARRNSQGSANVEAMYQLVDGKVEAMEFIIKKETRYTDVPLKNLPIKRNNLIACIARKREIIFPDGDDVLKVGDSVVLVTLDRQIQDLENIILP